MEPGCTAHIGAHMGPIWVPYRLLAGSFSLFVLIFTSQSAIFQSCWDRPSGFELVLSRE